MESIIINIETIDPFDLFGVNNSRLKMIQKAFGKLKIRARGNELKAEGDEQQLVSFKYKMDEIIQLLEGNSQLSDDTLTRLLELKNNDSNDFAGESNIILHGQDKKIIRARTPTQFKLMKSVDKNDVVFAVGPAGTGKTYTSVALAVKALKNKAVKRIVLTRPAVEAGENLGFLPGDMREKIDPYLRPLYDALYDMLPADTLARYLERKTIEVAPLAFMRGRTLDNSYVILDEAQNCSVLQLKMFLTRMGPDAKFIVNGDLTQIDLPSSQRSGLLHAIKILGRIDGIDVLEFQVEDITRHKLVKKIVRAYSKSSENRKED